MSIADEEGLASVSMARIADKLGFTTMSLYRYVASKDDVLALMSDAGTGAPIRSLRRSDDSSWRDAMERWCLAQYDLLMSRRWVTELALYTLPVGPNRLAWIESGLELLEDTPLDASTRFEVLGLLSQHVLGEARLQIELERLAQATARAEGASPGEVESATDPFLSFDALLQRLADPETYPSIYRAVNEGVTEPAVGSRPDHDQRRPEALFRIRTVLDGVDALIRRERRGRRRRPANDR